jgi:hypothetical protein
LQLSEVSQDEFSELRMKSIEHLGQVKMPLWKLAARSVFSIMKIMKSNQVLPILPFLFKLKVKQSQQKIYSCGARKTAQRHRQLSRSRYAWSG